MMPISISAKCLYQYSFGGWRRILTWHMNENSNAPLQTVCNVILNTILYIHLIARCISRVIHENRIWGVQQKENALCFLLILSSQTSKCFLNADYHHLWRSFDITTLFKYNITPPLQSRLLRSSRTSREGLKHNQIQKEEFLPPYQNTYKQILGWRVSENSAELDAHE